MKEKRILFLMIAIFIGCSDGQKTSSGAYLGQPLPDGDPVLFAPGILNTGMPTRDITFMPDGKEVYFCITIGNSRYITILYCKETENGWTNPEVLPFASDPKYVFMEPFISPDGNKLFFVSNKGNNFTAGNPYITDIWVAERKEGWWDEPYKLDTLINSAESEYFPSVSGNGNLYFTREEGREFIFRSEYKNGKYLKPEKLPPQVNAGISRYNATIAKDESFIIVPVYGLPDSKGSTDYYISFNDPQKGWSGLINLGDKVNSASRFEYSAGFSPDDKYFFFMSSKTNPETKKELSMKVLKEMYNLPENGNSNIYWLKSDFIFELKDKAIYSGN
jgi:Tol biopolymer transport system component